MLPLPLVIVAGGKSSRMGSDKALLPFGAFATLTQFQLSRFTPHVSALYVSCKTRAKFDFEASFIEDTLAFPQSSPLVALYSMLDFFKNPVCVLSVDTPFVPIDVFEKLSENMGAQTEAIIARSPFGVHPLCGIYTPTVLPYIKAMLEHNEHKIQSLLNMTRTLYVDFPEDAPFLNLNHPSEYDYAKGLI